MQKLNTHNTGNHNKNTTGSCTGNRNQNKNRYNTEVINRLKEKFGVSRRFITQSLKGDRTSETSESIKKEYSSLMKKLGTALK